MNRFFLIIATGFGVGYSPVAPGTLGTLVAIPIYYFLSDIPSPLYEITLIGFFFLSVWISENAQIFFGKKDDQRIVIDEIIGFLITMLWVPKTVMSASHQTDEMAELGYDELGHRQVHGGSRAGQ